MSAPALGIYRDVPYAEYASWPALRASVLNQCARTMAHGRHAEMGGEDDSPAKEFGAAFHAAVLEPARFREEWVVAPVCDRRTKVGKADWSEFVDAHPDKNFLTASDGEIADAMISSVYADPVAADLLAAAVAREVSVVWTDEGTGLLCKARIDLLTQRAGWTVVADLKSTRDAGWRGFQRQMTSLRYYASLAWYRRGLAALAPAERQCWLIAVEKSPPYLTACYEIDEAALEKGDEENTHLLARYAEARSSGVWNGYPGGVISLPEWMMRDMA